MKQRDVSLKKYGISKNRYRELKYYCMQYPEWIAKLGRCASVSAVNVTGMPTTRMSGNPTEKSAIERAELKEHCKRIEEAAMEADSSIYKYIIKNVTENIPYEYLGAVPCGREYFYKKRREFFYELSKRHNQGDMFS